MASTQSPPLDLLILGAGWTATFLIPQLQQHQHTFAATTRDGRDVSGVPTIPWSLDTSSTKSPSSDTSEKQPSATSDSYAQFASLPSARAILITFPLSGPGQSSLVVKGYTSTHSLPVHFIQLGSTGIWQNGGPTATPKAFTWTTRHSAYDRANPRAITEDELLGLGGTVLNLAGLWDGAQRDPRNWIARVARSKDDVRAKKSLHLVHGIDVARAVQAVLNSILRSSADSGDSVIRGQRYLLTDGFVYDWWALFLGWADVGAEVGEPSPQARWVRELMREEDVPALPRDMAVLGRCYDSREFWDVFGLTPLKARV